MQESGVESRFAALRSGETPLVGREEEIELLLRRWTQAKTGNGRVVLLSAEPGIGKSRLTETLHQRIAAKSYTRMRYFCSPHHQDSALLPVIAQLERAVGFEREDTLAVKRHKLAQLLAATLPAEDDLSLFAELLSIPGESSPSPELTPQRKKEKTFEALLRHLDNLARGSRERAGARSLVTVYPAAGASRSLRSLLRCASPRFAGDTPAADANE